MLIRKQTKQNKTKTCGAYKCDLVTFFSRVELLDLTENQSQLLQKVLLNGSLLFSVPWTLLK